MAAAMPPNPAISAMSCRLSSGIIAAVARRHCRGDGRAHAFGAGTGREVVKVLIGIDPHRIWTSPKLSTTWRRRGELLPFPETFILLIQNNWRFYRLSVPSARSRLFSCFSGGKPLHSILLPSAVKKSPSTKIRDMFWLFFGVIGGSTNDVGRIFILTAWNQFINWALIVVSAIKRNLCAFAGDGFSQKRKGKMGKVEHEILFRF